MTRLNRLMEAIPRVTFRFGGRAVPAFRTCGAAGFYAALLVSAGAALMTGRPLAPFLAAVSAAVASFFGWMFLRRAVTGHETIVLLEHVWLGLAAPAALLYALGLPILPYLDLMAPGLTLFLAGGRAGCLMVGCCHGHPSAFGVRYGEPHAEEGFPLHLVNVRLFPVQALELAGLLGIAAFSVPLLLWAREGAALAWFLFGYAVLRFGTEGLRGDERPEVAGISVPRIMCIAQVPVAIAVADAGSPPAVYGVLLAAGVLALAAWWRCDFARRALSRRHVDELRRCVSQWKNTQDAAGAVAATTSVGASVALSAWRGGQGASHVSIRLAGRDDPRTACWLAARAFPHLRPDKVGYTAEGTLHFVLPDETHERTPDPEKTFRRLYKALLRRQEDAPRPVQRERPWFFRQAG